VFLAAEGQAGTPSDIAKHVGLVHSAVDAIVIFAAPALSSHNRARLIAHGVAFAIPGNQLYIPELAMDLREHFRSRKERAADGLSPAAQAVLFYHLLLRDEEATTPSAIAGRLGYSAMSIGRAYDDLAAAGLAKTRKRGREKHLEFNEDRRTLLEKARPLLRSPVRTLRYVRHGKVPPALKLSGESALAEYTDLSPPRMKTYAIAASDWKAVAKNIELVEANDGEADFAVETWAYDPAGLSDGPSVDPLSLYAQFGEHPDERVSMAAGKLLEKLPW
jgi:DNA-binding MarR family transcriptional regulator